MIVGSSDIFCRTSKQTFNSSSENGKGSVTSCIQNISKVDGTYNLHREGFAAFILLLERQVAFLIKLPVQDAAPESNRHLIIERMSAFPLDQRHRFQWLSSTGEFFNPKVRVSSEKWRVTFNHVCHEVAGPTNGLAN